MISTSLVTTSVHPLYFQPSFGQTQTPFFSSEFPAFHHEAAVPFKAGIRTGCGVIY